MKDWILFLILSAVITVIEVFAALQLVMLLAS